MKKIQVAIDGPVSSGKSTIGKRVAQSLEYLFIDTGLMYRALACQIRNRDIKEEKWAETASQSQFEWRDNQTDPVLFVDGMNVMDNLWLPEIASLTSQVAVNSGVRKALVEIQRKMGQGGGVVMVGRDICNVVLPNAEAKIFLTASPRVRAQRRFQELESRGVKITLEQVEAELLERDKRDTTRTDSPLCASPDALQIDATRLTLEEVVGKILSLVRSRLG